MKVSVHPHAMLRMRDRGGTRAEVEYTVKHGTRSSANFDRTRFVHTFAYNRKWKGKLYRRKMVEAYAANEGPDDWLVITVIVKHFS